MNAATISIVIAIVVAAIVVAAYVQYRRSRQLREHYGPEYTAAVSALGDRSKAEAELRRREKRVHRLDIRPLSAAQADLYTGRWRKIESDFVDSPGVAIAHADDLLGEVMMARGYPVSDFEQRADDLSVDHARLVTDYRIAHEVAIRHAHGEVGTEDLRRAMLHYRDLFADLVAPAEPGRASETRSFQEEALDERAAPVADDTDGRRTDDRTVGERGASAHGG